MAVMDNAMMTTKPTTVNVTLDLQGKNVLKVSNILSLWLIHGTFLPVYRDKGTPSKKGGGSSFTVTKLPSSLELKGQRPLSLPHSP